jgi:presenilin-like A22 family membrane protease
METMKAVKKILKHLSLNILWVSMFIALYPIEDQHVIRISASFLAAGFHAIFTVLLEEDKTATKE